MHIYSSVLFFYFIRIFTLAADMGFAKNCRAVFIYFPFKIMSAVRLPHPPPCPNQPAASLRRNTSAGKSAAAEARRIRPL